MSTTSVFFTKPNAWLIISEVVKVNGKTYIVVPLKQTEFERLQSKPYKYPKKD
jgi:hypothetical protein